MSAAGSPALTAARLRIAQRALIAACDSNPELLTDDGWQKALQHVTTLVVTQAPAVEDSNQLSLFENPETRWRAFAQ